METDLVRQTELDLKQLQMQSLDSILISHESQPPFVPFYQIHFFVGRGARKQ